MKESNAYRLQYWLYAILNKKYGKQIKMKRSSLHKRYDVNLHDFSITGVKTDEVKSFLENYLKNANFDDGDTALNCLSRVTKVGKKIIEETIFINKRQEYQGKSLLNINVFVRKKHLEV